MTNKIDWNKPLRKTNGHKVRRVFCTDAIDPSYPVLVEMMDGCVMRYSSEGIHSVWENSNLENYSELLGVPIDTLIWVKDFPTQCWKTRYFAREKNGLAVCWETGLTSKTSYSECDVLEWKFYSLTRPEGCTHWTDKLENPKEAS